MTRSAPTPLDRLAEAAGIILAFEGADQTERHATETAKRELLAAFGIATDSAAAIADELDRLKLRGTARGRTQRPRCFMPDWLENGRCWGVTCQLYGLRSDRNWGIGDFADLATLGAAIASQGAAFIGVSPLHALFTAAPDRSSPYAPSSRRFLNPLYIATDWLDDAGQAPPHELRTGDLVDYARAVPLKLAALRGAFDAFRSNHLGTGSPPDSAFAAYRAERGEALRDFARFEAISHDRVDRSGLDASGWHGWPTELCDKASPAVAAFADANADEVAFHAWLQWTAEKQLHDVQHRLETAGMAIGLYLDIAVGVAPDGAETWTSPRATLPGVRIGAPPDLFNPGGQDWGLAPLSPRELAADAALYRDMLRCNMHSAGAIRIDHAMALERLYLIPEGQPNDHGAYVRYPRDRLIAELAEVSQLTGTIVIGEDLGTVRPGFRRILIQSEVQSYRVLQFERTAAGRFKPPSNWPQAALACFSTHDLATLAGWWSGSDHDELARLGRLDPLELRERQKERQTERRLLLEALRRSHVLPPASGADSAEAASHGIAIAVHRFLAATPCRLAAVQIEDLLGLHEQANVPGTIDEHPNWRRRLPVPVDRIAEQDLCRAILSAVAAERPRLAGTSRAATGQPRIDPA